MDHRAVIQRNIRWFLESGVMRPADGFWGVAERLLVVRGNEALEMVNRTFPSQTRIAPDLAVLEHRRADCNFEAALAFDLAAEVLRRPSLRAVADNILDFLLHRSALRHRREDAPTRDLWGWSVPVAPEGCWTDDNAWVVTLALVLARRGRPHLHEAGIAAARAMRRHMMTYYEFLDRHGKEARFKTPVMHGTNLSPHWLGLTTMAFAHAAAADPDTDYLPVVEPYYRYAPSGPPRHLVEGCPPTFTGLAWTLSEYGYLALAGSIAARQFGLPRIRDAARAAADALVEHQAKTGHFAAEYGEAPVAAHLADLVYTQNWATLGLYHAWRLFDGEPRYRRALDSSLALLERIQDRSRRPQCRGCWRGLYDTKRRRWGGGDRFEGGQNSLYTGWTNAPIAWAFLFDLAGSSLFAA